MPQQPDLLGPQPLTVTPDKGLAGPRLWVRRLVIWKEPGGEKVRDISLRPGLNVIWSPDGADDAASAEQANAIGHGSGKTLFCRLIRYCLGEDRFCHRAPARPYRHSVSERHRRRRGHTRRDLLGDRSPTRRPPQAHGRG